MNYIALNEAILSDLDAHVDAYYPPDEVWYESVKDALWELNNRRAVEPPSSVPEDREKAVAHVREHFKDDVTNTSLVLNHLFPDDFFFYRVSSLEDGIFQGLSHLSEVIPLFRFDLDGIGRKGFDKYLELNDAMREYASRIWPDTDARDRQRRINYYLYQGLGDLFTVKTDYNRYWLFVTNVDFEPDGGTVTWSGRKEMQRGDIVFMYRTSPVKAVVHLLKVTDDPSFDPWGGWQGFWVDLEHLAEIPPVGFSTMRSDPVLGQWSSVRKQFTGSITDPVPHSVYNRLLELIPRQLCSDLSLEPEALSELPDSGSYTCEADFEEKVVSPLLRRWSFKYQYQYPCRFYVGSQASACRVDYYVTDEIGPVTLFEDKYKIVSPESLDEAMRQGKSYALMFGLPSFVVCAPEGIWVYSLDRNVESLEFHCSLQDLEDQKTHESVRSLLLGLR